MARMQQDITSRGCRRVSSWRSAPLPMCASWPTCSTSTSPRRCDGRINCIAETFDDYLHLPLVHDERRGEQNMVSSGAINRAAHRVDEQAARHRFALDQCVQLQFRSKGLLGTAVSDQFDTAVQTTSADIADVMMVGEPLFQPALEMAAHLNHIGQQAIATNNILHRKPGGGGHRVAHIGMTVLEEARPFGKGLEYLLAEQDGPNRLIAAAQAF